MKIEGVGREKYESKMTKEEVKDLSCVGSKIKYDQKNSKLGKVFTSNLSQLE